MASACRYHRFGTPQVVPRERFDYWRTWFSEAVKAAILLEPAGKEVPDAFDSAAEVLEVGSCSALDLTCGSAHGSWRLEATEETGLVRVSLFLSATGADGHWHGRDVCLADGTPALFVRTAGWWRAPRGVRTIQINVPRAALPFSDARLERIAANGIPPASPVYTTVVHPLLVGLAGRLGRLGEAVHGVAGAAADLEATWTAAVTMLLRSLDGAAADGADVAAARRLQAIAVIDRHLADPRLDPAFVAKALHLSRRTLYALLAGEGVSALIRRRRVRRAAELLVDPAWAAHSVSEIARAVGIASAAQFSRIFRAELGCAPREHRARRGAAGAGRGRQAASGRTAPAPAQVSQVTGISPSPFAAAS